MMTKNDTFINAEGNLVIQGANVNSPDSVATHQVNAEQQLTLADTAQEIQALLTQLSQFYPVETSQGKFQLSEEALKLVKQNSSLKQRMVSAINAGTIGAIGQALSHPAATFFIEVVKDWHQSQPESRS